ncbi:hypothetical protein BpHYR1_037941 [Brachionus plicatilis]|uniref:Uncharacterized protein n=1 Tax=Brachionus plicatilis TaxID=10195 RepID=A0A3M7QE12_BRAPC|nr:hypothetical protein BpHYR1_037941 [Brachionus plicatilis]
MTLKKEKKRFSQEEISLNLVVWRLSAWASMELEIAASARDSEQNLVRHSSPRFYSIVEICFLPDCPSDHHQPFLMPLIFGKNLVTEIVQRKQKKQHSISKIVKQQNMNNSWKF